MKYSLFLAALASAAFVKAQTWSACNPMEKTTCPKNSALACTYSYNYSPNHAAPEFTKTGGGLIHYEDGVAKFRIEKSYDSPTLASNFYIMYGKVEVRMKAAPGAGIVSSVVLQSDTLDEIDWEWLGGRQDEGQSNYFGKGNTTTYDRGAFHAMNHQEFHTYGVEWTENTLYWLIDGAVVRTLYKADVKYDLYPQTPMQIKIGSWAGGDPDTNAEGVVQWAGGPTDYSKGPFDMIVESIKVTDYSNGNFYIYTDKSGSAKSIKSEGGAINVGPQNNACGAVEAKPEDSATTTTTEEIPVETEEPTETAIEDPVPTIEEDPLPTDVVEEPTDVEDIEEPTEVEDPETTTTGEATTTFPTITAPFQNSTHTTTSGAPLSTGIETPIDDEDCEETDEETDIPTETDVPTETDLPTEVTSTALPESTTVTTTMTQVQTITTCLAVTTTDAAGHEQVTSSTVVQVRTETVKSVVTVPCETTTIKAEDGHVVTTVVPGTVPVAVPTPTGGVEVPEVPSVETPEVPEVEVPEVPSVETPELPEVEIPEVEIPEVPSVETPELPEVEVPEVPEVEVPEVPEVEVPEVPSVETPVPSENSPVEGVPTPSKTQTYTTVTMTSCYTTCQPTGGALSTGVPPSPPSSNNGTTYPVFNGTATAPPVVPNEDVTETELETPPQEVSNDGTVEEVIEFDGGATGLKGGFAGVVVAGVVAFWVL